MLGSHFAIGPFPAAEHYTTLASAVLLLDDRGTCACILNYYSQKSSDRPISRESDATH